MVRFRPGKLAYLSESDTEVEKQKTEPTKQCAASSKRGSPRTPALSNCQNLQIRSSERIRRKQSQSFEMPTRKQVMSKIETLKSPAKMLDRLKPRRLVNDFTKETHRYNYDPNYTSGESSIDDFIDDDNEDSGSKSCSSSKESSLAEETPSPVPPIKNTSSSDDDQTPTKGKESNVATRKFTKTKTKGAKFTKTKVKGSTVSDENQSNSEDEQMNTSMKTSLSKGNLSDSSDNIVNSSTKTRVILSSSDADSSGSDVVQPGKNRNLKRCHESAKIASPQPSNNDPSIEASRHGAKRKLHMFGESSEASDANTNNQVENISDSTENESEEQEDRDDDDDEDDDSGSEVSKYSSSHNKNSSHCGHFHSHRAELMQRKRDKKRRLFSKLIQTRKRKNSNGKLSTV